MKYPISTLSAGAAGCLLASLSCHAGDWPNWRGPDHNGISAETGWTAKWPDQGPNVLWKASVGTGFSSVTVADGRACALGNKNDTDTVWCFDAATGSNLWKYSYPAAVQPNMYEGGPSATPTFDGGRVYAISKMGGVYCLDAATGKLLWSKNPGKETGAETPQWGYAGSPLVQGGLLILDMDGAGLALDKETGNIVWKSGAEASGYDTPVPCSFAGTPGVVLLTAKEVCGLETKTGKKLWSFPWKTQYDLNIADPLLSGNEVFLSAGYDHGAAMVRFNGAKADEVWENSRLRNHISSSVLVGGYVYGVDGPVNDPGGATLKCLEFSTGNEKWSHKGLGGGALMVADHKIIMLSDRGVLVAAQLSPESFTPVSSAQVLGGKCWTAPTLANGRIYCRNAKGDLVCLDVKGN